MNHFHALSVAEVRRETPDSVSIAFEIPAPLKPAFRFAPGQYLTVRATLGGGECRRSYSICSGADEAEIRIAVKKAPGGRFSAFANDILRAGARLDVTPPQGRFTAAPGFGRHLAFFAAGSGITPVLSIVRSALAHNPSTRATLVYGNRTTSSIMFREALEDLKDRYLDRLAVFHVLSRESQDIDILNGRVDGEKIARLARTIVPPSEVDAYFLCGPYGLIEEGRAALLAAGAEPSRIKSELFSADGAPKLASEFAPPPNGVALEAAATTRVDCVLDGVTYRLAVRADQHIVDAAREQGVELPYSCKGGMCCTCRCKVAAGEVAMDVNYSLEPWEIAAGFTLACQTRPISRTVTLDFDAA